VTRQDRLPQRISSAYGSLAAFYSADARRIGSREHDVGLWWREAAEGPLHRAAWVRDTGELYLVHLGPRSAGGGAVEVLAVLDDRNSLDRALAGWRERCGEPGSLGWLRQRSAALAAPHRRSAQPARARKARQPVVRDLLPGRGRGDELAVLRSYQRVAVERAQAHSNLLI
jgi:hypothetical protein